MSESAFLATLPTSWRESAPPATPNTQQTRNAQGSFVVPAALVASAAAVAYTAATYYFTRKSSKQRRNRPATPVPIVQTPMLSPARPAVPRPQTQTPMTPVNQKWLKGAEMGRGTYGCVYVGMNSRTGEHVAIKEMRDLRYTDDCRKEFQIMRGLSHRHIVKIRGLEVSNERALLVLEWCSGGTLLDVLKRHGPCNEALLRAFARQIVLGLQYLHANNIIHRDIKPANVLIDSAGVLKLTDFGLSRHTDTMATRTSLAGTPSYMSPETVRGCYVPATDLWAVGATLTQLATGEVPWSHIRDRDLRNPQALIYYIANGPFQSSTRIPPDHHPRIPESLTPSCRGFIKQLFAYEPEKRGTCDELLCHPWLVHHGPCPVSVESAMVESDDESAASTMPTVSTSTEGTSKCTSNNSCATAQGGQTAAYDDADDDTDVVVSADGIVVPPVAPPHVQSLGHMEDSMHRGSVTSSSGTSTNGPMSPARSC